MNLTTVDGVDEEKAQLLSDKLNIKYLEDLAGARCIDVEDIGLDSAIVADALRKANYPDDFVDSDHIAYECEFCGDVFAGIQHTSFHRHVKHRCEKRPEAQQQFTKEVV